MNTLPAWRKQFAKSQSFTRLEIEPRADSRRRVDPPGVIAYFGFFQTQQSARQLSQAPIITATTHSAVSRKLKGPLLLKTSRAANPSNNASAAKSETRSIHFPRRAAPGETGGSDWLRGASGQD